MLILKTKLFYIILVLLILIVAFFVWQMKAYKAPEPKFTVIKANGAIQIRQYLPLTIAEVQVEGDRSAVVNSGFRILADYIFGNNYTKKKIAMTVPVIQQGTKIPMTAPVLQQKTGQFWTVRFVMPAEFSLNTLPKPNNKNITLLEVPAKKYAVIRFSGMYTKSNLDNHEALLKKFILNNQLKQIGEPIYAYYNPPWILPFLRRNEIMIEVE